MSDDMIFLHGDSEPEGINLVLGEWEKDEMSDHVKSRIRNRHAEARKGVRDVTLLAFGVDHGLNAHAGNGEKWRTTVVAKIRLDYLKNAPIAYARLEDEAATELLAQLAQAVAIKGRIIH